MPFSLNKESLQQHAWCETQVVYPLPFPQTRVLSLLHWSGTISILVACLAWKLALTIFPQWEVTVCEVSTQHRHTHKNSSRENLFCFLQTRKMAKKYALGLQVLEAK